VTKTKTENVSQKRLAWINSFESGKRWFETVMGSGTGSEHTLRNYARTFYDFNAWLKKNPDELIAERKTDLKSEDETVKRKFEETVRRYRIYLQKERKVRTRSAITAILSFFKANYVELKLKIASDDYTPYKPAALDQIRNADLSTSLHNRLIIRFLLDTGMSREDAVEVTYGDIKDEFEKGLQFIRLQVKRRKENVQYATFIGSNFLTVFKQYKVLLQNKGVKITDKTPLLSGLQGQKYSPQLLTTLLSQLSHKVGFTISPHRIRKTFETLLSMQKVHPLTLKYWMGHKIGSDVDSRYILPNAEEQRKMYAEAYKAINLETQASVEERLKKIEELSRTLTPEQKAAMREWNIQLSERSGRKRKTEHDGGCADFKQIPEGELLQSLKEGWSVAHKLQNGDLIVQL
jgi:integrase